MQAAEAAIHEAVDHRGESRRRIEQRESDPDVHISDAAPHALRLDPELSWAGCRGASLSRSGAGREHRFAWWNLMLSFEGRMTWIVHARL